MNTQGTTSEHPLPPAAYAGDHPDVIQHTKRFLARKDDADLFAEFEPAMQAHRSRRSAALVGTSWLRFSQLMTVLPAEAVSRLTTSAMRHCVMQTAFEELGERDPNMVHSDLFRAALGEIGVTEHDLLDWSGFEPVTRAIARLRSHLVKSTSDAYLLGLLHGMEIPAEDIIEHLFEALAYDTAARTALDQSSFFEVHRVVETEHIRRGTANFLSFCPEVHHRMEFAGGFEDALRFWKEFWASLAAEMPRG